MPEYNWSGWAKQAAEASGGPTLPVAEGYTGRIVKGGAKTTKAGAPRLWWSVEVITGPHAGKQEILSQTLTVSNPTALTMFYRVLGQLGIDFSAVPDGTPPESIAQLAVGKVITFDFEHRTDDKGGKWADFKKITLVDAPVAQAPAPTPLPPAAPQAPAPAPEAPAAPAAGPTVEELQAQLAALQNQAAHAAAPAEAPAAPAGGAKLPF